MNSFGWACTKTRNTGTPRNTPEHRTKFDGVVLFSYYRPCKKMKCQCNLFRGVPVFLVLVHAIWMGGNPDWAALQIHLRTVRNFNFFISLGDAVNIA